LSSRSLILFLLSPKTLGLNLFITWDLKKAFDVSNIPKSFSDYFMYSLNKSLKDLGILDTSKAFLRSQVINKLRPNVLGDNKNKIKDLEDKIQLSLVFDVLKHFNLT
jgi:hypothetical protein